MTATRSPQASTALQSLADFPCEVCSAPSVGWMVTEDVAANGDDLYDCVSVCESHIPEGLERE